MLISGRSRKGTLTKILNKLQSGQNVTHEELRNSLSQYEFNELKSLYNDRKAFDEYYEDLRQYIISYEELVSSGDRAYESYRRGNSEQSKYEGFYERALEVLEEIRTEIPNIDDILRISAEKFYGGVYGTRLVPENMPRYLYSNSKYIEGAKAEKASLQQEAYYYIENLISNEP